jgi:hypothetical protein
MNDVARHHQHRRVARRRGTVAHRRRQLPAVRGQCRRLAARRRNCVPADPKSCASSWRASADGPVPFHYPAPDYFKPAARRFGCRWRMSCRRVDRRAAQHRRRVAFSSAAARGQRAGAAASAADRPPGLQRGARSLIIIMLCGLFVGMVLGLQGSRSAAAFRLGGCARRGRCTRTAEGARAGGHALLFAGRAGTALDLRDRPDARHRPAHGHAMMAVDPMRFVVAPRFLAG